MHKMPPTNPYKHEKPNKINQILIIERAASSKAKYEKSTVASFSGIPRQKEKVGHPNNKDNPDKC